MNKQVIEDCLRRLTSADDGMLSEEEANEIRMALGYPLPRTDQIFAVAEVSVNWVLGSDDEQETISQKFERILEINRQRGYRLHSFNLHRLMCPNNIMNETVIAVFEKVAQPGAKPRISLEEIENAQRTRQAAAAGATFASGL